MHIISSAALSVGLGSQHCWGRSKACSLWILHVLWVVLKTGHDGRRVQRSWPSANRDLRVVLIGGGGGPWHRAGGGGRASVEMKSVKSYRPTWSTDPSPWHRIGGCGRVSVEIFVKSYRPTWSPDPPRRMLISVDLPMKILYDQHRLSR